ncbi:MAG: YraN family protein [Puniceicoccales bacterium]
MKISAAKASFERMLERLGLRRTAEPGNPTPQQKSGSLAESYAADWLQQNKGFRIVARNWRHGHGEIDLIAKDRGVLVFIEVRARSEGALVSGFHSVTKKKRTTLRRCALGYLNRCHPAPRHFRFDITEVVLNNGNVGDLRHFEHVPIFKKYDRPTHV